MLVEAVSGQRAQFGGEFLDGVMGEGHAVDIAEARGLLADGLRQLGVAVPQVADERAAARVEIALAGVVVEPAALAANDLREALREPAVENVAVGVLVVGR